LPWLLPRTLVGLALLTGLRRGELFVLRWWDIDEPNRSLQVRAAVYEGVFDDPKTMASLRPSRCLIRRCIARSVEGAGEKNGGT
jgi:integrase